MLSKKVPSLFVLCMFFFFVLTGNCVLGAMEQIPTPEGDIYVQDFANILSNRQEVELNGLGRRIDDSTTSQVAVLTIETTGEMEMEEFANKAFRNYGLGTQEKNNGVLLVLAIKDEKIRIEVGYGLEGILPDGKAGRILDETAIPYLQNNLPDQAIMKTYSKLANVVAEGYEGSGEQVNEPENVIPSWILIVLIVGVLIVDFIFLGGTLSYALLSVLARGSSGGGGPRGGGGGSSGGGGAGRGW
ncbi:TPM domain-containing protein [Peribacillus glennii]|uniref:TPM domain-containing protein n=1 Tax=Peribacillus glennii TaxID=2303991 RepID=A0A372L8Z0_9BACI|nr:TPM domain-containing protein [Peribacillus glennii]RFU62012.1 TPM domain-containing protein [Peribacillus glennii]